MCLRGWEKKAPFLILSLNIFLTLIRVHVHTYKYYLTFLYSSCTECADRELLPSFHDVSVYPKKELPFFILFTAGLCSFTAMLALLTHQYPESM